MEESVSAESGFMDNGTRQQAAPQPAENFRSDFAINRDLPPELTALDAISMNYAWSWLPGGVELYRDLAPRLWEQCEQNPRLLLKRIDELVLRQWAADSEYVERLQKFASDLSGYMSAAGNAAEIAYFCAEYGVHNSLPNYSGGLGILAGDHLKSSSDLNIPLVAVGLLYRFGYFRQRISHSGWQEEAYSDVFDSELALSPVLNADGTRVIVNVHIRGREVACQAWLARIGRVDLYLLDTNIPQNSEVDRLITGHLYGGDQETRIVQEKVLGIGGVRLLRALEASPKTFHLNEGHSAFLTLELAQEYLAAHPEASFEDAKRSVREQCVFTTHTPVDAGNDAFNPETLQACFSSEYIDSLKISRDEFFDLGRTDPNNDAEFFGMTPLALRMCRSANGVSEKHGEVSRKLWAKMFVQGAAVGPSSIEEERADARTQNTSEQAEGRDLNVPIGYITNGVHPRTWIAPVFQSMYEKAFGDDWNDLTRDAAGWSKLIDSLPDAEVWTAHQTLKQLLVAFVRKRLSVGDSGAENTIHENIDTSSLLSAEALTIGFARRVAAYKRWDLILKDVDRLLRLVDNAERPVQFVFAGKAHPQDQTAKAILQELMSINHGSGWQRRAVFIEDYDQEVARYLVHGVDVWMNVPRRPLEASGTSGMKAAMNGVLNFSILDGWWIEGYNGENGFAIGGLETTGDEAAIDAADAESLYSSLEGLVIPTFYSLGDDSLPSQWIRMMKNSIATLTPKFSTDRMVGEYVDKIYRIG
jgi:starch phosphorylase